jgi:hypothetical protein
MATSSIHSTLVVMDYYYYSKEQQQSGYSRTAAVRILKNSSSQEYRYGS